MVDEDSHLTDLSVLGRKTWSFKFYWLIIFFGFIEDKVIQQRWLRCKIAQRMLRNLTFVVQFAYFSTRP